MSGNVYGRLLSWVKDHRDQGVKLVVVGGMLVLGAGLFIADYVRSVTEMDGVLERNAQGGGSRVESFDVVLEDGRERLPVEIEVSEERYSKEEAEEMFQRVIRRMEALILGENESLDRVESDLDLVTEVPGEPVEITWELDRYDIMTIQGAIQADAVENQMETQESGDAGILVKLSAVLTYTEDETLQAMYQCAACIYPKTLSAKEKHQKTVKEEISRQEEQKGEEKRWQLPKSIEGKKAVYYRQMDMRGLVLMGMSVLTAILLYALQKQNVHKDQESRREQMMRDYPEIINKMTLFLGAGMTVKRAWRKVVEDYEQQKQELGIRYAYEEMQKTCWEMESGVTETESYENFGRRCNVQAYIRFGALLSQNLRKGTRGLTDLLRMESIQAFEDRKARARRLGEEAGTKLLLPMFLMLAIVLVIVIVPAFLSIQM